MEMSLSGAWDGEERRWAQRVVQVKCRNRGIEKRPGCRGIAREEEGTMGVLSEEVGSSQKPKNLMEQLGICIWLYLKWKNIKESTEWEKHI